jgi:hypothetical protein
MEEVLRSLALMGGATAVIVPSVAAFINQSRLVRAEGNNLVIRVEGQRFVIDVDSLDSADVELIDDATRAVERTSKVLA